MNRRESLRTITAAAVAGFPAILKSQNQRPNVLFVMTDDQRWDAMSCAGNKILQTPNMDRLARGGVRFTNAFATNPLCSPSRGTIMTGLYSHAHGVTTNSGRSHYLRGDVQTYPMLQQRAGYYTAMVGKWHIASTPPGFDHWCILPGQGVYHDPQMLTASGRLQFRGYVDDVIADQALTTLQARPKNKPFSLVCNFKAPHREWFPAKRFEHVYDGITIPDPPNFNTGLEDRPEGIRNTDMQIADMPDFYARGVDKNLPRAERKKLNYQLFLKNYYRTILGVDENLGRILDYLDKEGLAENTIVIYTGDNGFFLGEYGMFDKRLMYEPSIRVPMLLRYPAGVKAGQVDTGHMVLNNDVAHTVAEYSGVQLPAYARNHGMSWKPLLEGKPTEWRADWLYENFEYPGPHCAPKARGIRNKEWKLIHYIQQPEAFEMFHLPGDPEEKKNLAAHPDYQSQFRKMKARLDQLRQMTQDDRGEDGTAPEPCGNRMSGRR
ncbi:MAG TPA: sulfatase [Bryobacteraceae bacterium]|nr:sulfatase [Bryobacteraceae bacterium]